MKKVILSVTNDLTSEQRVHKVALFLKKFGFDVTLVGRRRRKSLPLDARSYKTKRLFLLFEQGPLFYAEYNLRLFFYLLFHRADVLVANDLDTLLANFLASKFRSVTLVHDSHEYFTGVPELEGRPGVRKIWKRLERWIFPKLELVYTVNDSIADLYRSEYGTQARVVRNFPISLPALPSKKSREELGVPAGKKIILYQGSVNVDRGLVEAVEAMQYVEDALLLIVGDGDILEEIKTCAGKLKLNDRVLFYKRVPFEQLQQFTLHADIGISLDKDTNINYRFSLPNKIFDYMHSGVPVLASTLVEIRKIYSAFEVGLLVESHDPQHIAEKMNKMLSDDAGRKRWKENCLLASSNYCWEKEEIVLSEIYCKFV